LTQQFHPAVGDAPQRRSVARAALRTAVAVALLLTLFYHIPVDEVLACLAAARIPPVLVVLLAMNMGVWLSSVKLWLLLRTDAPDVSYIIVVRAYYVGAFFNNFLPTSVGGDLVKIAELRRGGVPLRHAAAATVVERGSGVLVMLGIAAFVSVFWGGLFAALDLRGLRWPLAAAVFGVFVAGGCLFVLWQRALKPWLKQRRERRIPGLLYRAIESFYVFRNRPRVLMAALGLSVAFYALVATTFFAAVKATGADVAATGAVGIIPLVGLPELLPVSVGGLGIREGMLAYCLSRLGPTLSQAAAAAVLLRLLNYATASVGGCLYALSRRHDPGEPVQ
jgi:glycosyltransferase 2 family protein